MPCGLCNEKERGADEKKDYLCSDCVGKMIRMDIYQKRTYIDSLYLKNQDEEARFLEIIFMGGTRINKKTTSKLITRREGKI
jgi:hypothetical protein